jgi:hypothetical protein
VQLLNGDSALTDHHDAATADGSTPLVDDAPRCPPPRLAAACATASLEAGACETSAAGLLVPLSSVAASSS